MSNEWVDSVINLKKSYRNTERMLRKAIEEAKEESDKELLSDMLSDCLFSIEWMHTGRRPGNRRGIERRAGYQREYLVDPLIMQSYISNTKAASPTSLSDYQKFQIEDALSRLSERERECYELAHGQCFSFDEIADLLKISKSSVQKYVERAQKKVSIDLVSSLFLVG